jgi:peptidase MA superfamily protein
VVIYGKKPFFDVTQAPSWSGGINDGTLRIPVDGLTAMTPELSRVLKHELTHSFLTLISYGRCPGWLHEGVAQLLEPADLSARGSFVAAAFAKGQQVPLQRLRGSFTTLNTDQARVAYGESLAVMDYIRSRYSMAAVQQILKTIAAGSSAEEALQSVISLDYEQLEKNVGAYVSETYGNE